MESLGKTNINPQREHDILDAIQSVIDPKINAAVEKASKKVSGKEVRKLRLQAYILTAKNDDNSTILHLACYTGNLELLQFIVDQAGPQHLDILKFIINSEDSMGLTPFYRLCERGYQKKFCLKNQQEDKFRVQMCNLLLNGQVENTTKENKAYWCEIADQVKFTPLHWLAYWNDYESI